MHNKKKGERKRTEKDYRNENTNDEAFQFSTLFLCWIEIVRYSHQSVNKNKDLQYFGKAIIF